MVRTYVDSLVSPLPLSSWPLCCPAALSLLLPPLVQKEGLGGRWCPEEEAGPVSLLLFSWVTGLLRVGHRQTLEAGDLWDVHSQDSAAKVAAVLDRQWAAQRRKPRSGHRRTALQAVSMAKGGGLLFSLTRTSAFSKASSLFKASVAIGLPGTAGVAPR